VVQLASIDIDARLGPNRDIIVRYRLEFPVGDLNQSRQGREPATNNLGNGRYCLILYVMLDFGPGMLQYRSYLNLRN
jgi:hypothetical protein